ncbi:MAG: hypothetical protein KDD43_12835, partial [Bdellovibrionales bacterium]|nr:hypothetical protein [Bdellovibrionales bacterium]
RELVDSKLGTGGVPLVGWHHPVVNNKPEPNRAGMEYVPPPEMKPRNSAVSGVAHAQSMQIPKKAAMGFAHRVSNPPVETHSMSYRDVRGPHVHTIEDKRQMLDNM